MGPYYRPMDTRFICGFSDSSGSVAKRSYGNGTKRSRFHRRVLGFLGGGGKGVIRKGEEAIEPDPPGGQSGGDGTSYDWGPGNRGGQGRAGGNGAGAEHGRPGMAGRSAGTVWIQV